MEVPVRIVGSRFPHMVTNANLLIDYGPPEASRDEKIPEEPKSVRATIESLYLFGSP